MGPVEARRGGELLDLGGPLQRTLLACLLLRTGEVVSRERLIDVLWGDDPPPQAAHNLETKVSRLRLALGSEAPVLARAGGYVLEVPSDRVDLYHFEQAASEGRALLPEDPQEAKARLAAALSLWRGHALGGIAEGTLAVERNRLEDDRLQAIEARIDADLALGAGPTLVSELEALRSEHPLRERFTEQLMVALYRAGRQTEALEVYRDAHRALTEELGLEPGPRLRELEQAILRHDESLGLLPLPQRLARAARSPRVAAVAAGCIALLVLALTILPGSGDRSGQGPPRGPGLMLLDAATGAVRADFPVGSNSLGLSRFGYGFLWSMGDGIMSQVDPRSRKLVRSIPLGVLPAGIAVGAGGVWVSDRNSPTLLRVEPLTGEVNLRVRLSGRGLRDPGHIGGIAIDRGALWVARGSEAIDRLDPSSLRVRHRIRLDQGDCGQAQCAVAAGGGRVWVAGGDNGMVTGIDAASNRVIATTSLRPYLCCVTVGGGFVWVAEGHGVAQLSPRGRLLRRFRAKEGGGDLAYVGGYVWGTSGAKLLRIGVRDHRVRTTTHRGRLLINIAAQRDNVAVAALPVDTDVTKGLGPKVLRIGLTQDWLNVADPAVTRSPSGTKRWQWQLHRATCGQLYRPRDPSGAARAAPQPELAAGPPRKSADGRTWTIPLRTGAGMRFSPPLKRRVTAEDVRATLVRALSPQLGSRAPAVDVLRDVSGLSAYRRGAATDIAGISAHRGTLQIRTRRPVPDLAARLALPYFCVLPAGIPAVPGGYPNPLPTAGPYYLSAHEGGTVAVLRPNPGYRGPRPRRLDGIIIQMPVDDRDGPRDVRRGRLDFFWSRRHSAISKRVGCRVTRAPVPDPELAALCIRDQEG